MTTKDFLNGIRRRIAQGESKKDIYNQYTMTEWESCVTRFLPTQVSLRSRKKWGWLNNILLACLALITVFKVLDVFFLTSDLGSNTGRCIVLLIAATINIAIIVAIARFSGIAYLLAICFAGRGIANIFEAMGKVSLSFDLGSAIFVLNAALVVSSLVLLLILYKVLLPNTNFILQPKRNAMGNPIFDD